MTTLYLIAHKVRGQPAFDVATQMPCPECDLGRRGEVEDTDCGECDGLGYWWIIPTSGHRAYPYWDVALTEIDERYVLMFEAHKDGFTLCPPPMPEGLPDHYTTREAPRQDLVSLLGLIQSPLTRQPPLKRRF